MQRRGQLWTAFFSVLFAQFLLSLIACGGQASETCSNRTLVIIGTIVVLALLTAFAFAAGPEKVARKVYELLKLGVRDDTGRFTVVAVFVAIAAAVGFALHTTDIFDKLRDSSYARGVITYLITIATIGLAFILVLQAMFKNETPDNFKGAREILTVMMGVLGTIVGFYFGSTTDQAHSLRVVTLQASMTAEKKERVQAFVEGGAPPYTYTVSFDGDKPPKQRTGESSTGFISEEAIDATPPVGVKLEIIDAKNGVTNKRVPAPTSSPDVPPAANPQPNIQEHPPSPPSAPPR